MQKMDSRLILGSRHELPLGLLRDGVSLAPASSARAPCQVCPLGPQALRPGALCRTVRFLFLPALKFHSPHVSLLIKNLPGAPTSAPHRPSAPATAAFSPTLGTR